MPDLLLELRSEEIPARMQRKAAGDLKKLVTDALVDAGLTYEGAREYWTPRRLTLDIRGLDARSKDSREERKGPKVGAPAPAIEGFLRSAGLASIDEARIQSDKKGEFYVAVVEKPGRPAEEIVAQVMPGIIRDFPWPKSMRWGPASAKPGSLRWVRPLQSILCVFGPEIGETAVIDFEVGGLRSGDRTAGHRFHAPEPFKVRRFEDYVAKLEAARVVLDAERRKEIIRTDAQNLAFARGLEIVEDEALLEEVAGLVEWPVVLMGEFEEAFLAIPPEMIRLTIRANQKCFVTRRQGAEALSNQFLLVAAIEASDHGAEIARGNGKVVRARLSDALYFWNTDQHDLPDRAGLEASASAFGLDLAKPLDQRMAKLDALGVTFHAKLGTQGERVKRIAALAETLAPMVGADAALARRAAVLAKADLTTEAVGEFPELQGLMGRRYAALQGEHESVRAAIEDHYKPQGPGDRVPSDPVAIAVALADKLDTLVGFFMVNERPTGSKDPYALRRAALGIIKIILANKLQLRLVTALIAAVKNLIFVIPSSSEISGSLWAVDLREKGLRLTIEASVEVVLFESAEAAKQRIRMQQRRGRFTDNVRIDAFPDDGSQTQICKDLLAFFHDRLTVQLRDEGTRHDLLDAVLSGGERGAAKDDLLDISARVAALGRLLETEDGKNLLAAYRRAANILAAEEKKGTSVGAEVDPARFVEPEERALFEAIERAEADLSQALASENYTESTAALAKLRAPADAFFDKVLVNADDDALRANRLALLARIRTATERVADFSTIVGGS